MKRAVAVASIAVALLAGACSAVAPPSGESQTAVPEPKAFLVPLRVDNSEVDFGRFALEVVDYAGLITSAASDDVGVGVADDRLVANAGEDRLHVTWLGGACSHRPVLTVAGDSGDLRVELNSERQIPGDPQECPAIGFIFGVTLSLSETLRDDDVEFTSVSRR